MKVIIGGAGYASLGLARVLSASSHDVTLVDVDTRRLEACNSMDVRTVTGSVSNPDVLREAGAPYADILLALTRIDEVNIVACQVAHALFKVPTKVAYVRTEDYRKPEWQAVFSHEHFSIDAAVSPQTETAGSIFNRLKIPGATDVVPLVDERFYLIAIRVDRRCFMTDNPAEATRGHAPLLDISIMAIVQQDDILFPSRGDKQICVGDEVYFICSRQHAHAALELFGVDATADSTSRVLIIGGSDVGSGLVQRLEQDKSVRVHLVEVDERRAENLASKFKNALVIHGSGTEQAVLSEADVGSMDVVIGATADDRTNLISCALSKQLGCSHAVSLLHGNSLVPLVSQMGLDGFVGAWLGAASVALRYVRPGRIRALHVLCKGLLEVHEIEIAETFPYIGQCLGELALPGGVFPTVLIRDGQFMDWRCLLSVSLGKGDILIVCIAASAATQAQDFFRPVSMI